MYLFLLEKKVLHFVSGNLKKFEEICAILNENLPEIEVKQIIIDLPELQGEPEEIVRQKLKLALDSSKGPLIVEDTSLCFNAISGLPGPYIKSFLTKLGTKGLYRMISSYEDHTGYSQCVFGMAKNKKDIPKIFIGKTDGTIVEPRGPDNFGWDPVFQPLGFDKTYAELDKEVKNSLSHRYKALKELVDWIKKNPEFF